jgi:hypothetical protein
MEMVRVVGLKFGKTVSRSLFDSMKSRGLFFDQNFRSSSSFLNFGNLFIVPCPFVLSLVPGGNDPHLPGAYREDDSEKPVSIRAPKPELAFFTPGMLDVKCGEEGIVVKDFFTFPPLDVMSDPVLFPVSVIPVKLEHIRQQTGWHYAPLYIVNIYKSHR